MAEHRIQTPSARQSGLIASVHRLAAGRELQLNDAVPYFGHPERLASLVELSGILADPAKRRDLEMLLLEARHGL